jgi:hypothetical protein
VWVSLSPSTKYFFFECIHDPGRRERESEKLCGFVFCVLQICKCGVHVSGHIFLHNAYEKINFVGRCMHICARDVWGGILLTYSLSLKVIW